MWYFGGCADLTKISLETICCWEIYTLTSVFPNSGAYSGKDGQSVSLDKAPFPPGQMSDDPMDDPMMDPLTPPPPKSADPVMRSNQLMVNGDGRLRSISNPDQQQNGVSPNMLQRVSSVNSTSSATSKLEVGSWFPAFSNSKWMHSWKYTLLKSKQNISAAIEFMNKSLERKIYILKR